MSAVACLAALLPLAAEARSPHVPDGYELSFADEMDGNELDAGRWIGHWDRWSIRHLEGNGDRAIKAMDHERLDGEPTVAERLRLGFGPRAHYLHEVSDGTLKLRSYPLALPISGFPYAASMISSERSFAQHLGYWELRLRLNAIGKGHHLAVWLLPDDGGWPPEIDLLEVVGGDPHFYANARPDGPGLSSVRDDGEAGRWLVIGFEWNADAMIWTLDGETVREHAPVAVERPLYFLVTWEIGSRWPGPTDATTPWPGEIEIDYVRVYSRDIE